jgi:TPR repeat protein
MKDLINENEDHDPVEVFAMLYAAAEQGHADAQVKMGTYYNLGEITAENFPKAAYYYSLAAKQNHAEGLFKLARCYLYNPGKYQLIESSIEAITDDLFYEKKAFKLLKKAAKQNHAGAIFEIADFLEQGKGGLRERKNGHVGDGFDEERKEGLYTIEEQLHSKANKLYIRAAELGLLAAQQKVFWYYLTVQIGDSYDTEKISYWANKLLDNPNHNSESLKDLGLRLENEANHINNLDYDLEGLVSRPHYHDPCRTQKWINFLYKISLRSFLMSYEMGSDLSAVEAGMIYLFGPDEIRDVSTAYNLFKESGAHYYMAYCHSHGLGCILNYHEAIRLLEKEYNEKVSRGESWNISKVVYDLGKIYDLKGGSENFKKAFEWYRLGTSSQCYYQTGICYLFGYADHNDDTRAFEFFRKASTANPHIPIDSRIQSYSSGDRSAHGPYGLALCLYGGLGVNKSLSDAFYCLSRAVCRGKLHSKYLCPSERDAYMQSLHMLGIFWGQGLGVPKNLNKSSFFFAVASRMGHKKSILELAEMLEQRAKNKISFEFDYEWYVQEIGSDLLCSQHMRSLVIGLDSGKTQEHELPFTDDIDIDQRLDSYLLDGKIADASSFDWKYDFK